MCTQTLTPTFLCIRILTWREIRSIWRILERRWPSFLWNMSSALKASISFRKPWVDSVSLAAWRSGGYMHVNCVTVSLAAWRSKLDTCMWTVLFVLWTICGVPWRTGYICVNNLRYTWICNAAAFCHLFVIGPVHLYYLCLPVSTIFNFCRIAETVCYLCTDHSCWCAPVGFVLNVCRVTEETSETPNKRLKIRNVYSRAESKRSSVKTTKSHRRGYERTSVIAGKERRRAY